MFGNDSSPAALAALAQQLWQMAQRQAASGGSGMPNGFSGFGPMGSFPPLGFPPAGLASDPFAWMKSAAPWSFSTAQPQMPDFPALLAQLSQMGEAAANANPFAQMRDAFETWMQQAASFGEAAGQAVEHAGVGSMRTWMKTPGIGLLREEQERWQATILAKLELDELTHKFLRHFQDLMQKTQSRYERLLDGASASGKKPESARAAFDLWIDAGEQVWAEIAMSEAFQNDLGELTNAQMRFQKALQAQIDRAAAAAGLPSRVEVDAAARKIAVLEREVRALKAQLKASESRTREAAMAAREPAPAKSQSTPESAVVVSLPVTPRTAAESIDANVGDKPVSRKSPKSERRTPKVAKSARPTVAAKSGKAAKPSRREAAPPAPVALFPLVDGPRAFGRKLPDVPPKSDNRAKRKVGK